MSGQRLEVLDDSLRDLRSRCEEQLRCLGEAQRSMEAYRHASSADAGLRDRIIGHLQDVLHNALVIHECVQDCASLAEHLPASGTRTNACDSTG